MLNSWLVTMVTTRPARSHSRVRGPGWGRCSPTARRSGSRRCSSSPTTRRWRRVPTWRGAPGWARRPSGWVRPADSLKWQICRRSWSCVKPLQLPFYAWRTDWPREFLANQFCLFIYSFIFLREIILYRYVTWSLLLLNIFNLHA